MEFSGSIAEKTKGETRCEQCRRRFLDGGKERADYTACAAKRQHGCAGLGDSQLEARSSKLEARSSKLEA
jgi:hypothetical protein